MPNLLVSSKYIGKSYHTNMSRSEQDWYDLFTPGNNTHNTSNNDFFKIMDGPSYNKKQSHTVESMIQVASDYKADTNISFDKMH